VVLLVGLALMGAVIVVAYLINRRND